MSVRCEKCNQGFTSKPSYNRHLRKKHSDSIQDTDLPFICYRCDQSFISTSAIEKHFTQIHDFNLQCDNIQFSTEESFLEWKSRIESENQHHPNCSFVVYRGGRLASDGSLTRYFVCSLSSLYGRRRGKGKEARYYCPSRIYMQKKTDGTVHVSYVSTHIPHSHFNNPIALKYRADLRKGLEMLSTFVENTEDFQKLEVLHGAIQQLIQKMGQASPVHRNDSESFAMSDLERIMEATDNSLQANDSRDGFSIDGMDDFLNADNVNECFANDAGSFMDLDDNEVSLERFMNICGVTGLVELSSEALEPSYTSDNAFYSSQSQLSNFFLEDLFNDSSNATFANRPANAKKDESDAIKPSAKHNLITSPSWMNYVRNANIDKTSDKERT